MTERKTLESERAELVRVADDLDSFVHDLREEGNSDATAAWLEKRVTALRSLAAQDQKPVATIHCGPKFLVEWHIRKPADGSIKVYTSPPPAAGWNAAIETAIRVAKKNGSKVHPRVEALRHNAPLDSGAGESDDAGARISNLAADLVVSGWMASNAQDVERRKKEAEQKLLDFACDEIERHMKRNPSALPDYGGADAGVIEQHKREWVRQIQNEIWDDDLAVKIVELAELNGLFDVVKFALSKPAPVAASASAEARLREALEHYANEYCEGWCEQDAGCANFDDCGGCLARRALSAHPHASDCDKQGER